MKVLLARFAMHEQSTIMAEKSGAAGNLRAPPVKTLSHYAALAIGALLLASCQKAAVGNDLDSNDPSTSIAVPTPAPMPSAPPPLASPNLRDALEAVPRILGALPGPMLKFGRIGVPQQCSPGQMAGEAVMVCHVCMKVILFKRSIDTIRDIIPQKIDVVVPFKQAIDYEQPGISPAPGNTGVWVVNMPNPMMTGAPATLSYQILLENLLSPEDVAPLGIFTRADSGTFQVGTRPLGGHDPWLRYIHIPEDAQSFIRVLSNKNLPLSFAKGLGECPAA